MNNTLNKLTTIKESVIDLTTALNAAFAAFFAAVTESDYDKKIRLMCEKNEEAYKKRQEEWEKFYKYVSLTLDFSFHHGSMGKGGGPLVCFIREGSRWPVPKQEKAYIRITVDCRDNLDTHSPHQWDVDAFIKAYEAVHHCRLIEVQPREQKDGTVNTKIVEEGKTLRPS